MNQENTNQSQTSSMKQVVVYSPTTGQIFSVVQIPPEISDETVALPGSNTMRGTLETLQDPGSWFVDLSGNTPELARRTPVPLTAGKWISVDAYSGQQTEFPSEIILEEASLLIAAELRKRANAPITVDGVTFDADKTAQENIKAKLTEISALRRLNQTMPTELLVWRDFHNTSHTFSDMESLERVLSRVVVAIAQRGTELYIWSWQVKASIAALGSAHEIEQYLLSQDVALR